MSNGPYVDEGEMVTDGTLYNEGGRLSACGAHDSRYRVPRVGSLRLSLQ
jgi:hypothetical protein